MGSRISLNKLLPGSSRNICLQTANRILVSLPPLSLLRVHKKRGNFVRPEPASQFSTFPTNIRLP